MKDIMGRTFTDIEQQSQHLKRDVLTQMGEG